MTTLRPRRPERGFILVMGMMFMLMCTLLGLAMFRSFGLQERVAGNTRDKQRAFEAAQTTLQYGEWWLRSGADTTPVTCSDVADGNQLAKMRVCDSALADAAQLPWPARIEYQPPAMQYLGLSPEGTGFLYQVSAYAYGGNADTAAVVQSTYKLTSAVKDLGQE